VSPATLPRSGNRPASPLRGRWPRPGLPRHRVCGRMRHRTGRDRWTAGGARTPTRPAGFPYPREEPRGYRLRAPRWPRCASWSGPPRQSSWPRCRQPLHRAATALHRAAADLHRAATDLHRHSEAVRKLRRTEDDQRAYLARCRFDHDVRHGFRTASVRKYALRERERAGRSQRIQGWPGGRPGRRAETPPSCPARSRIRATNIDTPA